MASLNPLSLQDATKQAQDKVTHLEHMCAIIAKLEPGLRKWDGKNIDKRMETFLRKECGLGLDDEYILSIGVTYSWHELTVRTAGSYTNKVVTMNLGYTSKGKVFNYQEVVGGSNTYYFGKAQEDLAKRKAVLATQKLPNMITRYEALLRELGEIEAGLKECGVYLQN